MKRKEAIKVMTAGVVALSLPNTASSYTLTNNQKLKGNINHSASRWCYSKLSLKDLCLSAKKMGLMGIDLLKPSEIDEVQSLGLKATMVNPEEFSLTEGFNDPALHSVLQVKYRELIDIVAAKKEKNIICFSGNRNGLSDQEGLDNCVKGLTPLVSYASEKGVVIHMELLNSLVDHEDYQCDHTEWGVKLCQQLDSDHFKLLYDIYHMQIMEGNLIANIKAYHPYFGHYHTGGVPGRNEIDESQEIYYPAVMKAILATGYQGVVAQEFIPTADDPLDSLKASIAICDV